jgi:hypothetical protein
MICTDDFVIPIMYDLYAKKIQRLAVYDWHNLQSVAVVYYISCKQNIKTD